MVALTSATCCATRKSDRLKAVCVFCGSSVGVRPDYREAATQLGTLLGRQGIGLVYGGASVGLMGAVADAALAAGGRVVGVIPRRLVDRELAHPGLAELHVTESMHERKALMSELSDAFAALPGGFGTLEELAEVTTWAQLGLHRKPIGLLNVAGYFDLLLEFTGRMLAEGFLTAEHRRLLVTARSAEDLLAGLRAYQPLTTEKWRPPPPP
jgi:uncharacterized protein (TIGR00730 family)